MKPELHNALINSSRILVVNTGNASEAFLSYSFCQNLKEEYPDTEITFFTSEAIKSLSKKIPCIDNYYYTEKYKQGLKSFLKKRSFDAVFFTRPTRNEAYAAYKAGIPIRFGSINRWYKVLFTSKINHNRKDGTKHETEYNLDFIRLVTGNEYRTNYIQPYLKPSLEKEWLSLLSAASINKKYILIYVANSDADTDWEAGNFGKLAKILSRKYNLPVVVYGTEHDALRCKRAEVETKAPLIIQEKLNIGKLAVAIKLAEIVLSNGNIAPHIAASFDVPSFSVYSNNSEWNVVRWRALNRAASLSPLIPKDDSDEDFSTVNIENAVRLCEDLLENKKSQL